MLLRFCFLVPLFCFAGSWSDDRLAQMCLEEKVGQLFVAPAAPLREDGHWQDWQDLLKKYHIGNALLKASDPATQVQFLEKLQSASSIPLGWLGSIESNRLQKNSGLMNKLRSY